MYHRYFLGTRRRKNTYKSIEFTERYWLKTANFFLLALAVFTWVSDTDELHTSIQMYNILLTLV